MKSTPKKKPSKRPTKIKKLDKTFLKFEKELWEMIPESTQSAVEQKSISMTLTGLGSDFDRALFESKPGTKLNLRLSSGTVSFVRI